MRLRADRSRGDLYRATSCVTFTRLDVSLNVSRAAYLRELYVTVIANGAAKFPARLT